MAIIKRQYHTPKPQDAAQREVPDKWWGEFVSCFDSGSAWNERCNGWVNEQYQSGVTPKAAFRKCRTIRF